MANEELGERECEKCYHCEVCWLFKLQCEEQTGQYLKTKSKDIAPICLYFNIPAPHLG